MIHGTGRMVGLETLQEDHLLFRGEEGAVLRPGRNEEERGEGHENGEDAFDDEDPAPALEPTDAIELDQQISEEAAEGAGKGRGEEEEGVAEEELMALVVAADEVGAAWGVGQRTVLGR